MKKLLVFFAALLLFTSYANCQHHEFSVSLGYYSPFGKLANYYGPGGGINFNYSKSKVGFNKNGFTWGISLSHASFRPTQDLLILEHEGTEYGTYKFGKYSYGALLFDFEYHYQLCEKLEISPGLNIGFYGVTTQYEYSDDLNQISDEGFRNQERGHFGFSPKITTTYMFNERLGISWVTQIHCFSADKKEDADYTFGNQFVSFMPVRKGKIFSQSIQLGWRF